MTESSKDTLFVCRANIGRSQVAQELFNRLGVGISESAGTRVDRPGQKLKDNLLAKVIIRVMLEDHGIDMSENVRHSLGMSMFEDYRRVVIMAETLTRPVAFLMHENVEVWDVPDLKDLPEEETRVVINGIDNRVKQFAGAKSAMKT